MPASAPPPEPRLLLALTTVGQREDATRLARGAVVAGLAACVQLQAIESVYRWDGVLQLEAEWRLLLKTDALRWPALQAWLRERHPYAQPALLALPVAEAEAGFAAWWRGELSAEAP